MYDTTMRGSRAPYLQLQLEREQRLREQRRALGPAWLHEPGAAELRRRFEQLRERALRSEEDNPAPF